MAMYPEMFKKQIEIGKAGLRVLTKYEAIATSKEDLEKIAQARAYCQCVIDISALIVKAIGATAVKKIDDEVKEAPKPEEPKAKEAPKPEEPKEAPKPEEPKAPTLDDLF